MSVPTILKELLENAVSSASGIGYLRENGDCETQTYRELIEVSSRVLTGLRRARLLPGEPAVLALDHNRDFLSAFWGCILGGIVPVPLAAPGGLRPGPALERLAAVWVRLGRPRIIAAGERTGEWPVAPRSILPLSELLAQEPASEFHCASPDDTAFVQFSSGSTGQPKGVILTHRNVMANLESIRAGLQISPADSSVNWMPLYHDMGLIGFHLTPLYTCRPQYHLQPHAMARRPLAWIEVLSRTGATITGCPNFSCALVLSALKRARNLSWDLSRVRLILNGAEPISTGLMDRFLDALAPYGLRREAMFPVYGLSEATLAATFPVPGELPRVLMMNDLPVVSVGRPVAGLELRIAPKGTPEGAVGEIQLRGANVTSGYWGDAEATREAFDGSWLRTGDLGFQSEGRLFVAGRKKDIIFVDGRNLHAQDVEAIAARAGVSVGRVAVCGWHDPAEGREKLLLFLAAPDAAAAVPVAIAVKREIRVAIGITPDAFVPLKPNQFPKTTSGKLQRYRLREQFERGEFAAAAAAMAQLIEAEERRRGPRVMPRTATEQTLQKMWCREMQCAPEDVGVHDDFKDLGGKSIQAVAILAALDEHFGVRVHSDVLAEHGTIARLAVYLDRHAAALQAGGGKYFSG
jgi:acyl-CoA synthetase (AMP-forming)/AMP-acid ligase II